MNLHFLSIVTRPPGIVSNFETYSEGAPVISSLWLTWTSSEDRRKAQTMKSCIRTRITHPLAALAVILAACATFFAPVTHADPILYDITFNTTSGTAPTGGSFLYDASASIGSQFSSFYATWDGIQFDLTVAANSPEFLAGDGGCSESIFLFLETGSACTTHAPSWPK